MDVLYKQSTYSKSKINLLVGTVLIKLNYSRLSKRYHLQITDNSPEVDNVRKYLQVSNNLFTAISMYPQILVYIFGFKEWGEKKPLLDRPNSFLQTSPFPHH